MDRRVTGRTPDQFGTNACPARRRRWTAPYVLGQRRVTARTGVLTAHSGTGRLEGLGRGHRAVASAAAAACSGAHQPGPTTVRPGAAAGHLKHGYSFKAYSGGGVVCRHAAGEPCLHVQSRECAAELRLGGGRQYGAPVSSSVARCAAEWLEPKTTEDQSCIYAGPTFTLLHGLGPGVGALRRRGSGAGGACAPQLKNNAAGPPLNYCNDQHKTLAYMQQLISGGAWHACVCVEKCEGVTVLA